MNDIQGWIGHKTAERRMVDGVISYRTTENQSLALMLSTFQSAEQELTGANLYDIDGFVEGLELKGHRTASECRKMLNHVRAPSGDMDLRRQYAARLIGVMVAHRKAEYATRRERELEAQKAVLTEVAGKPLQATPTQEAEAAPPPASDGNALTVARRIQIGINTKDVIEREVIRRAKEMRETNKLLTRIQIAEAISGEFKRLGYQGVRPTKRRPYISAGTIERYFPRGLTGGYANNGRKSSKK